MSKNIKKWTTIRPEEMDQFKVPTYSFLNELLERIQDLEEDVEKLIDGLRGECPIEQLEFSFEEED